MKRSNRVMFALIITAAVAIGLFITLAHQHTIIVPYLSPAIITIEGLNTHYEKGAMLNFNVKVSGYGSNCLSMEIRTFAVSTGEQVYFYKKADDCKHMNISYGQYDYTRSFTYGGVPVIGVDGEYRVQIDFADLVDNQRASIDKFFTVSG